MMICRSDNNFAQQTHFLKFVQVPGMFVESLMPAFFRKTSLDLKSFKTLLEMDWDLKYHWKEMMRKCSEPCLRRVLWSEFLPEKDVVRYVPQFEPNIVEQTLLREHMVSAASTQVKYNERRALEIMETQDRFSYFIILLDVILMYKFVSQ